RRTRPTAHRDRRGRGQHGGPATRALPGRPRRLRRDRRAAGRRPHPRRGAHRARLVARGDGPMSVVVAVDGPAGSGKSSVSRAAATRLGFDFLDTGAAYRALTWLALERGTDLADADAVVALIDD